MVFAWALAREAHAPRPSAPPTARALATDGGAQEEEPAAAPEGGEGAKAPENVKKGYVGIHATGFKDFLLKPEILRAIVDCGFEHPSEGARARGAATGARCRVAGPAPNRRPARARRR